MIMSSISLCVLGKIRGGEKMGRSPVLPLTVLRGSYTVGQAGTAKFLKMACMAFL